MDLNTLKEIDIIAFGHRAKIARAIKELNASYYGIPISSPSTSLATGLPATPDSYVAPRSATDGRFGTPPLASPLSMNAAHKSIVPGSLQESSVTEDLKGLGLAETNSAEGRQTPVMAAEGTTSAPTPQSQASRRRQATDDSGAARITPDDAQEELADGDKIAEVSDASIDWWCVPV